MIGMHAIWLLSALGGYYLLEIRVPDILGARASFSRLVQFFSVKVTL